MLLVLFLIVLLRRLYIYENRKEEYSLGEYWKVKKCSCKRDIAIV